MSGTLNYEKDYTKLVQRRTKSPEELAISRARELGFPNCKGLYPDCLEKPNKNKKPCKFCPVLDGD